MRKIYSTAVLIVVLAIESGIWLYEDSALGEFKEISRVAQLAQSKREELARLEKVRRLVEKEPVPGPSQGNGLARLATKSEQDAYLTKAKREERPEFQKLRHEIEKVRRETKYALLWPRLKLTDESRRALESLLIDKEKLPEDLNSVLQESSNQLRASNDVGKFVREARALTQAELENKIRDEIGPENYNVYQDYEKNNGAYMLLVQLNQTVAEGADQLSPFQMEKLSGILRDSAPKSSAGQTMLLPALTQTEAQVFAGDERFVTIAAGSTLIADNGSVFANWPISDESVNRAAPFLTQRQYSALSQIAEQQRAAAEMARKLYF